MNRQCIILLTAALLCALHASAADILVEAESFSDKGGWVVDQQFMDQMGSPYLMAHGIGKPVADAYTTVVFPETGTYYMFVRTFNWTSPWYKGEGPGKFNVLIDGKKLPAVLGIEGDRWLWQKAGKVSIKNRQTKIALHDLTGFNGRCDALYFTKDAAGIPPDDVKTLGELRRKMLNIEIKDGGDYELVVCGAGMAGICAAVAAARLGVKVALINDRPVVGGNSSSEIRVSTGGDGKYLYPNIGKIMQVIRIPRELNANGGTAELYGDDKKMNLIHNTPNLTLFSSLHIIRAETDGDKIRAVTARHIETGEEYRFTGALFADCTGDATVGYLAGADWRMGSESRYEAFESLAPYKAENHVLGSSNLWAFETAGEPSSFPALDWACRITEESAIAEDKPDWRWEGGYAKNPIEDAENIRDQNLRAIFGNWSYLKNNHPKYANRKITWMAFLSGKRESRRLMGDIILNQNDILNQVRYDDASFTTVWPIDLHYPDPRNSRFFPGQEFFSYCVQTPIYPCHVPYRCLYSRNIGNLFMAGRNISVTHVAHGSIRVQLTTAMMGEVVGMAASVCKKHHSLPRSVYQQHLGELKALMSKGVGEN
ncbi:MAG: FAD-dependent oxidoreductase [Tannerella sp.]|jgi:hypothetical protein|nr:FAD-dependent oxidoreductase [Tannerella sp.]